MKLTETQKQHISSSSERAALTQAFFKLMEKWELSREQEATLLGWSYEESRTKMDNLRKGKSVLAQDRDKFERLVDLLNIHKSLRVLFPYDRDLVYQWVKVPRERFGGHSALEVMMEDGKEGVTAIRRYLDYERTR